MCSSLESGRNFSVLDWSPRDQIEKTRIYVLRKRKIIYELGLVQGNDYEFGLLLFSNHSPVLLFVYFCWIIFCCSLSRPTVREMTFYCPEFSSKLQKAHQVHILLVLQLSNASILKFLLSKIILFTIKKLRGVLCITYVCGTSSYATCYRKITERTQHRLGNSKLVKKVSSQFSKVSRSESNNDQCAYAKHTLCWALSMRAI